MEAIVADFVFTIISAVKFIIMHNSYHLRDSHNHFDASDDH